MDGERKIHADGFVGEPDSLPTVGGSFVVENGVTRPLSAEEEQASADARSALTPADMKRFEAEHAAKLEAKAKTSDVQESTEAATPRRASRRA
jgi:hypothetical protein